MTDFTGDMLPEMGFENSSIELLFVSGLGKSYSRKTRAFVLRNHFRLQRARNLKRRSSGYVYKDENEKAKEGHSPTSLPGAELLDADGRQVILSPLHCIVGQSRADPFQSCAKVLTDFEQEMLDQWTQTPFTTFNITRPTCFSAQRDLLYDWCRRDEGLVDAAIYYAIGALESRGIVINQMQTFHYRRSVFSMINHRINVEGRNPSWILLMAVAAVLCTLPESTDPVNVKDVAAVAREMSMHVNGFRSLARAKGGWYATTTHLKGLTWLCVWTDITVNGELSIGSVLPPTDPFHWFSPSQHGTFSVDLCLVVYAEELVRAYTAFRHMALVNHQIVSYPSNTAPSASSKPVDLFRRGTHVYQLIEASVSRCLRPTSALFLVHLILQFCQNHSSTSQFEWFQILRSKLDAVDVLRNGSVEVAMWGLMTDMRTHRLWHRECVEILVRHLYVECRLSTVTQRKLRDTLLEFLDVGPANGVTGNSSELAWWTPEDFRNIVHRDLGYNCHDLTGN